MKRRLKLNAAYMDIDKSVVMQTTFNIRQDIMGEHPRLTIAKDCIIGGSFVFESSEGKVTIDEHTYIGGSTFISRSSITLKIRSLIVIFRFLFLYTFFYPYLKLIRTCCYPLKEIGG